MKVSEMVASIFRGAQDAGIAIEPDEHETAPAALAAPAPSPAPTAQAQRLAELEQQLAEQQSRAIETRAAAFADGAIRNRQALPAERESLISLYRQAAIDDGRDQGQRVASIEALIAARPAHALTQETVAVGPAGVLEPTPRADGMTAERRAQLLGLTPLGQHVARAKTA